MAESVRLRLPCRVELSGIGGVSGYTREISTESVFVNCQVAATLYPGMSGLITLNFKEQGSSVNETLKIRTHISRVDPGGLALSLHYSELADLQQRLLERVLRHG